MKTSIPKLHSIKFKDGIYAPNVVEHPDIPYNTRETTHVRPLDVLKGAAEEKLYDVVIFGYDENGLEYVATSSDDPTLAAYMFARGQLLMLREADGHD